MNFCVIPKCVKENLGSETVFTLTRLCEIEADFFSEKAKNALLKFLEESFSLTVLGTGKERIILKADSSIAHKEGYTLKISSNLVEITGADESGVFYAVQTLKQLLMQGNLNLPKAEIEDYPRFSHRGFMLDVARYFFTKEAIFQFLDMMALHKLNVFHFHLSDDQGFRMQFDEKFLLSEIGSYRSHTNFSNVPHSGYYTKEDLKEIIQYAHRLCIKVIPEIDTPGHTVSMIAAYPELSCFERKLVPETHWGVKHDVLCVGKESTFEFMFSLFDELLEVFTDGVVHLGGDEVPTTRWELCPHCQKRIKEENLKDESDLHTYYLQRIADYLAFKGIQVIMWNDRIKPYMVTKNVAWQLWNGDMSEGELVSEANSGRNFVVSAAEYFYFNYPYAITNLKKCYDFSVCYKDITTQNLKGIECCLWSEYVPDMETAEYLLYPRLGAFSETAWSKNNSKDYERFKRNLPSYYKMLDFYKINYAKPKSVMPKGITKAAGKLYWKRRPLHWHGFYNKIDNALVKKKYAHKENEEG